MQTALSRWGVCNGVFWSCASEVPTIKYIGLFSPLKCFCFSSPFFFSLTGVICMMPTRVPMWLEDYQEAPIGGMPCARRTERMMSRFTPGGRGQASRLSRSQALRGSLPQRGLGNVAGSGVGGAILMISVGFIKQALAK
jgi:hypothetical protein